MSVDSSKSVNSNVDTVNWFGEALYNGMMMSAVEDSTDPALLKSQESETEGELLFPATNSD